MRKTNIARRRGTTIAAAALSLALVAPAVQPVANPGAVPAAFASTKDEAGQPNANSNGVKYPGVNADGIYQTSVGEPRYTFQPPKKKAGTVESGTTQGDTESIQGFVLNTRNGNMAVHPGTKNYRPIPMEGVRVYAEWVDKDGYTSPTYTTVTGPDGRFAIKMRPFFDALGGLHEFDADPNGPQYEKIRVWAENPDGETFQQVYGYNNGFLGPQEATIDTQGSNTHWLVSSNRVSNVSFFYGEKPQNDVMHKMDQAVENPVKSSGQGGQVQGKAFWEQDHTQGAFTWNLMNTLNSGDVAAEGLKIYGSYLSDYAINKIMNEAPADLGVDEIRKGTRRAWSRDDEAALQNWIKREMATDTEKDPVTGKFGKDRWIAETVMATVGADNNYTLQFNGTFGEDEKGDRGTGGSKGNPLTRNDGTKVTFPDGSEHVAWDLLGTVAPDPNYGTFRKGALGNSSDKMPKHVNWDWLFVSTEDVPGFGVQTPWQTNGYLDVGSYNTNDGWNVVRVGEHLNTSFISLYADYVTFDVTPYDSAENWAKPGDVAETNTNGVPTKFANNLKYEIEWVNADTGEVVTTSEPLEAGSNGELPSFPLNTGDEDLFPNGIDKTTTFRADLYPIDIAEGNARGSRIAADSFTVLVGWAPIYEEKKGKAGEPLKSGVPTFDNTTTDEVESEKGSDLPSPVSKFEIPETVQAPEGYTVDLDESTGEVTLTFPKDAKPGTKFEVPVVAVLEDGTRTVGSAPFEVAVDTDTTVEPEYEDKLVEPGTPAESKPVFKKQDKDGNVTDETVDAPEGSEFSIPDSFKAPEGYTVEVDKTTGVVTVEADPEKLDKDTVEEFEVPVTVEYPDGSKDHAKAKFELDTDGDGIPDSEDDDDDNDGISDKEEIEKGSNPKDKGEIPATPLEPGTKRPDWDDASTTPNKPVDIPKKDGSGDVPEGSKVDVTDGPGKAEIGEDGTITVTPSEDAKPDDTITVVVKDKDGNELDTIEVTIDPSSAQNLEPIYEDQKVVPGTPAESKPVFKKQDKDGNVTDETVDAPEGSEFSIPDSFKAPEGYTVEVDKTTGVVTVEADPEKLDKDTVEEFEVPVTVEYPDGSKDDAKAKFELDTDGDGIPDSEDDDDDNDGISDKEEIEKGSNPKDKGEIPATPLEPGTKRPDWDDASTTPNKPVDIPKKDGSGDVPEGSKVDVTDGPGKAEIGEDGTITVTPSEDAKPGDKVVVVVKDPKGNEIDRIEVEIKDETAPTVNPVKEGDKEITGRGDRPDERIIVTLPDSTEIKTTTDKDGNWTVKVPEDKPLSRGDKIEVRDGARNKAKTVTVGEKKISSSEREGCTESLIGFGLPLLALIPLGIASQTAIPGLQDIQAQVGRQIQDANSALQNQLGIMDPRLAKAAADFDAQLKGAGTNLNQVLGGLAVLAYGIAAITTIATKCGPGNTKTETNVEVSSIFGKGSSSKGKDENSSSSSKGKDEDSSSSSKPKGDKGSSGSEGKDGSGKGAEAETPAEGKNAQ
ncbi:YPDG domain-containing protein [Corynebacterium sp. 20_84]